MDSFGVFLKIQFVMVVRHAGLVAKLYLAHYRITHAYWAGSRATRSMRLEHDPVFHVGFACQPINRLPIDLGIGIHEVIQRAVILARAQVVTPSASGQRNPVLLNTTKVIIDLVLRAL